MTILAGLLSLLVVVVLGMGASQIGRASVSDARAQLAADATALAAVAEMGPGGSGFPEPTARRYAGYNGARLIRCICLPGASAVQVTVAVGDVAARARAEFDPTLLRPAEVAGRDTSAP